MTGYEKSRERLMRQIMALSFVQTELNLFLDTHPQNRKAFREFRAVTEQLAELRQYYKENFGPLTAAEVKSETAWNWIESPWPWEN